MKTRLSITLEALGHQGGTLAQVNKELREMLDLPQDFCILDATEGEFLRMVKCINLVHPYHTFLVDAFIASATRL